jgi:outer membrane receptor protein involved in Fe transport
MYNEPLVSVTKFQLEGRRLGNADLEPETRISYEIGLQQEVFTDIAVDVTAYYTDYKNLLGIEQLTTLDRVTYTRYVNRDYGNSRGVTLDITKRAGFVNGGINYTLSYANGSASSPDQLELINTATQIGGESEVFVDRKVLPLDWDQRHTLNAFINFVKPNNWSIGLVGFVDSGQPFSPDFFARFDLNEREYQNSASKPTQWSVDLKAQKNFHFWGVEPVLFLKIDNLFDNLNHETVYARTGRADVQTDLPELKELEVERLEKEGNFTYDEVYMNPDFFSPPRKVQIGLDIRF